MILESIWFSLMRSEDPVRPVHPRFEHPAADPRRWRHSSDAEGLRAAGDACPGAAESSLQNRPAGAVMAGHIRRGGQPVESGGRSTSGAGRSEPPPSVHPNRTRLWLRLLRDRHDAGHITTRRPMDGRRAGSSGENNDFRCSSASTSSAAIRIWMSHSMRRPFRGGMPGWL